MKKILIVAGGTGGHIFPALAVAEALSAQGHQVSWLGARYGLENKLVFDKYPMQVITMRGMRRSGWKAKLLMPWRLLKAIWQSWQVLRKLKPEVVLAMGGYVAAPAGLAAWLQQRPLVIHEQNSRAGLTNRLLARFASVRFQAFPGALPGAIAIGNPVRKNLLTTPPPEQRYLPTADQLKILIIGGSQGARAINQCVVKVWQQRKNWHEVAVWHQTGELDFATINAAYQELAVEAKVADFIADMAVAYQWADLVICRAGALTVSEIAAVGVASVLIPYPYAVDNHQYHNAQYLVGNQAAVLMPQAELTPEKLSIVLQRFIDNKPSLLMMAQSARKLAENGAAKKIAAQCVLQASSK